MAVASNCGERLQRLSRGGVVDRELLRSVVGLAIDGNHRVPGSVSSVYGLWRPIFTDRL